MSYSRMIRFSDGHYDVYLLNGEFYESCDTYGEAQDVVDELKRIA